MQTPPPHSAKKVAGVRAYHSARKNEPVQLQAVNVTVHELEMLSPDATSIESEIRSSPLVSRPSLLRLRIVCSAGFYVRSLAHELGQALGCGAHLEALRRTRAGSFGLDRAVPVELLATNPIGARDAMIPMHDLLGHLAAVIVSEEGARRIKHGNSVTPRHIVAGAPSAIASAPIGLFDSSGTLLAVAERRPDASLHPLTVLV